MNDQIVAMETRIAAEEKIQREIKELTKLEKDLPAVKAECAKKRAESADLNKEVISLKELVAKNEKEFKEGKADVTIYKKTTFETEQKI
jgi:chromosome segregation ATPase